MKKLVAVSILLTVLTAAAFAQFKVGLEASFQPDVLLITTPTGDATIDDDNDPDTQFPNYDGTGTFDFFTNQDTWIDSDLDLSLSYLDPDGKFGGLVQFDAKTWLQGFIQGYYSSFQDFLEQTKFGNGFGDWNLWGKVGIFKAYVGNTANRGVTQRYEDNFNSFVDNFKIDNYGIITPIRRSASFGTTAATNANAIVGGAALDINNLKPHIYKIANDTGTGYLSVSADLAPIVVDVAGDLGALDIRTSNDSYANAGAALRVSAKAIADIVDFDVIYKFYGGDDDTDVKITKPPLTENEQPGGEGYWTHAFGLYANLNIIDGLGIGVGYSGTTAAQENEKVTTSGTDIMRYVYPYLNGIDLRFKFNAIDKLTLTFNNNFSFSAIVNDSDNHTVVYALDGNEFKTPSGTSNDWDRAQEISQGYFAMYNALGVSFGITDALKANLTIGNKLNTWNETNKIDESKTVITDVTTDTFFGTASALYSFTDNVSLEAGLALSTTGNTFQQTDQNTLNWGTFTFGIPIRFKVSF